MQQCPVSIPPNVSLILLRQLQTINPSLEFSESLVAIFSLCKTVGAGFCVQATNGFLFLETVFFFSAASLASSAFARGNKTPSSGWTDSRKVSINGDVDYPEGALPGRAIIRAEARIKSTYTSVYEAKNPAEDYPRINHVNRKASPRLLYTPLLSMFRRKFKIHEQLEILVNLNYYVIIAGQLLASI